MLLLYISKKLKQEDSKFKKAYLGNSVKPLISKEKVKSMRVQMDCNSFQAQTLTEVWLHVFRKLQA